MGVKVADFIRKIAKWTYFTLLPPSGSLCGPVVNMDHDCTFDKFKAKIFLGGLTVNSVPKGVEILLAIQAKVTL